MKSSWKELQEHDDRNIHRDRNSQVTINFWIQHQRCPYTDFSSWRHLRTYSWLFCSGTIIGYAIESPPGETHGQEIGRFPRIRSQKQRLNFPLHFGKALPQIFSTRFRRKKEIVWFRLQAMLLQSLVLWAVNLLSPIKGPRERSTYILYVHRCKIDTPTFGRL